MTILEDFAAWLLGVFGEIFGSILAIALFFAIAYLVWGSIWHRILHRLGFRGKAFWILFEMLFAPAVLVPGSAQLFGEYAQVTEWLGGVSVASIYIALILIAVLPIGSDSA